jgi:hypothetical protein
MEWSRPGGCVAQQVDGRSGLQCEKRWDALCQAWMQEAQASKRTAD